MKLFHIFFLSLFSLSLLMSCQPEEVASLKMNSFSSPDHSKFEPVEYHRSIPPDDVICTNYPTTTKWRIIYDNPDPFNAKYYQRFFSTVDGSIRTLHELNNSKKATDRADMNILFGTLKAPHEYEQQLKYSEAARETQFVPSDLTHWELITLTEKNSTFLQSEFESNSFWPTAYQPYNYNFDGYEPPSYEEGEIYLFKTDQNPVIYGAVRIVEKYQLEEDSDKHIIEITVQKNDTISK